MTVDLNRYLTLWSGTEPWREPLPQWSEQDAGQFAELLVARGLENRWHPVAEEFMTFRVPGGDGSIVAMVSVYFPLAIVAERGDVASAADIERGPAVVRVPDLHENALSADPALLRATVLRWGWTDPDFDPRAFSAADLFIESS